MLASPVKPTNLPSRPRGGMLLVWSLYCVFAFHIPAITRGQSSQPNATAAVRYQVSFEQAANHYVHVTVAISAAEPGEEILMPVWTPGSYLVREYARHVDSVRAVSEDGSPVEINKITKNRWKLSIDQPQNITIHYRVYCNELSVRTNFVDADFALLNGAALFLTTESRLDKKQIVSVDLPGQWKQCITSLERRVALGANRFVASSFDELVDSPIVAGNPTLHPFEVGGVQHFLVNQGGDGLWDGEKAAADVAKIVRVHQEMWGNIPYERYYFLNVIAESGGGLEHDNSSVMLSSRWSYRDQSRYQSWLGLVSHEFFHTWNVRRLRPRALSSYDYETENYFQELWVAEGVTSYYDDLALARSGHLSKRKYLDALSKQIKTLQSTDGRFKQSLAQASHDAWIKFYRPDENSRNTSISYYNKGAVAAFLLDIEIRKATNNAKSLDDCLRGLYADFALKEGYTTEDIVAEVNRQTGGQWNDWFERAIFSTEELDFAPALDWLGLKFAHDSASESEPPQSSEATDAPPASSPIWTGMSTRSSSGRLLVTQVAENGPAFSAGINVDDEIIAVNNYRVSSSLTDRIKPFGAADEVEILLARRDALLTVELPIVRRPVQSWKLIPVAKPTDQQNENLNAWLHVNPY